MKESVCEDEEGDEWIYEEKMDGSRIFVVVCVLLLLHTLSHTHNFEKNYHL